MPEFAGRHYMNPAYGRAMAQPDGDDGDNSGAQEAARNGNLKHLAIHIQKDGGFSVHAHYQHARAGHHSVESKLATSDEAAEEVKRHLRGHESRRADRSSASTPGDGSED